MNCIALANKISESSWWSHKLDDRVWNLSFLCTEWNVSMFSSVSCALISSSSMWIERDECACSSRISIRLFECKTKHAIHAKKNSILRWKVKWLALRYKIRLAACACACVRMTIALNKFNYCSSHPPYIRLTSAAAVALHSYITLWWQLTNLITSVHPSSSHMYI